MRRDPDLAVPLDSRSDLGSPSLAPGAGAQPSHLSPPPPEAAGYQGSSVGVGPTILTMGLGEGTTTTISAQ